MNVKKLIGNPFFFISALIVVYYGWDKVIALSKSGAEKAQAIKELESEQGAGIVGGLYMRNIVTPEPTKPSSGAETPNILTSIVEAILPKQTTPPPQIVQAKQTASGAGITFPAVVQPVAPAPAVVDIPAVVQPQTVAPAFTRISGGVGIVF